MRCLTCLVCWDQSQQALCPGRSRMMWLTSCFVSSMLLLVCLLELAGRIETHLDLVRSSWSSRQEAEWKLVFILLTADESFCGKGSTWWQRRISYLFISPLKPEKLPLTRLTPRLNNLLDESSRSLGLKFGSLIQWLSSESHVLLLFPFLSFGLLTRLSRLPRCHPPRYVHSPLLLQDSASSAWWPHKSPASRVCCSGEGSRWQGFCSGTQEGRWKGSQGYSSRWGVEVSRLNPKETPNHSPPLGRTAHLEPALLAEGGSSWGLLQLLSKWRTMLGGWLGSAAFMDYHLPLTTSGQKLHWGPHTLWQMGFCFSVFLILDNIHSFPPSPPLAPFKSQLWTKCPEFRESAPPRCSPSPKHWAHHIAL